MSQRPKTIHGAWNQESGAVELVDAHHHLWDLRRNSYPWLRQLDPHFFLGDYSPIMRDYGPRDYLADARGHNVVATVHVEAEMDRAAQLRESEWLTAIHAEFGFPNAIVAHAWFHTPEGPDIIARQAGFPLVRGIRSKPVTAPSPGAILQGAPGSMQDEKWLRGLALLERYGLSWDLRVPPWHLPEAARVATAFPRIPIVLNHTGFPWDRSEAGLANWIAGMEAIAAAPNVWLKVSEFGLKDQPWDYESNRRIVHEAIRIFGIERCMFATNFPVAGLRASYERIVRSVRRMLEERTEAERHQFFVANAKRFYRL
jgi:predicted TIM-barrel fold metal-dependent hydrolase